MREYSFESFVEAAQERGVPEHLIEGLCSYVWRGRPTGSFLEAVMSSDLFEAFRRGDEESLRGLRNLVMFLYNDCPAGCYGSEKTYAIWITKGGLKGVLEAADVKA